VSSKLDPVIMKRLGSTIRNLAETLDHNLMKDDLAIAEKRFERSVLTDVGITQTAYLDFSELVREKGQMLLENFANFLTANEGIDFDDNEKADVKAGVEIFLFIEKDD